MNFFANAIASKQDFITETGATICMVVVTSIIAGIIGMLGGLALTLTQEGGLWENQKVYWVLDKVVNIFRSIPFIILLALISPVTRAIVKTNILSGSIEFLEDVPFGNLVVLFEGSPDAIEQAKQYMIDQDVDLRVVDKEVI